MPVYEYKCKKCRRSLEEMHPITAIPDRVKCKCGAMARKVYSRGAVLTDGDVKWLESAKATLPKDAENIQTRSEHKRYLRDHNLACIG